MKSFVTLVRLVVLAASTFTAVNAYADPMPFTSSLVAGDPTQKGRLSRNGVPQDYAGDEPFSGVINPTTTYHFHAYSVYVGNTPFITLTIDSTAATTFMSVYQTAYQPTNLSVNWLGDAGTSGNYFGTDPISFNVVAAINSTIIIIINESTTNGGLGLPFTLYAQGAIDSANDGPTGPDFLPVDLAIVNAPGSAVIPEPSTALLLLAPLVGAAALRTRRRRGTAAVATA